MSVFKEGHHFLLRFAKRQVRVYPDKQIHGIIVTDAKSPSCIEIRDGLLEKIYFGNLKQHRNESRSRNRVRVCVTIYIPWEERGVIYGKPVTRCSKWQIIYVHDLITNIHYISFTEVLTIVSDSVIWGKEVK